MKHLPAVVVADLIRLYLARHSQTATNLKLQKLLYYSQGWFVAITGDALFEDNIEAWVHGPVVPPVFRRFRDYRWNFLPAIDWTPELKEASHFSVNAYTVGAHIDQVVRLYGGFAGPDLETMTHRETPWIIARKGLAADTPSNAVISIQSLKDYFNPQLQYGR